MNNVSVQFLAGDLAVGLASIYVLTEYYPQDDFLVMQIAAPTLAGLLLNVLFFTGASPMVMFLHSLIGGILAMYLYPIILNWLL